MNQRESPVYLFGKTALLNLADFINRSTLFAFDLDGTLAPIVSDPTAIAISDTVRKAFADLNEQAPVAVITGRSRSDALTHLGVTPRYLIGNHGAEGLPGWASRENDFVRTVQEWQNQLDILLPLEDSAGIEIENKGATLSIHYRRAANMEFARSLILQIAGKLDPQPRYIGGKYIVNLLPPGAPDKGTALLQLIRRSSCAGALFVGDDETDEDIFRLDSKNIFTVRIGQNAHSRARFFLLDQSEIGRLLHVLNLFLNQIIDPIAG